MRESAGVGGYGARAAAVLAAAILLGGCAEKAKHGAGSAARPVVSGVEVIVVQPVPRETAAEAVGTVRAKTVAAVAPQVMGRLTAVPVSEGMRVESGALLATIDDAAVRAQLSSAEGAVAEAEAAREEAERAVAQAEAGKSLAEKTFSRHEKLYADKVVTRQEYEEAEMRRTVAVKEHERAVQKRAQGTARVAQAKGAADAVRTQLAWAKVTAPFAGVVVEKRADAGSMAVPGVPILLLEDPRQYRFEAAVSETYLPLLKVGSTVRVLLDAGPGGEFPASVTEVIPTVDPASRTFMVKVDLPAGKARSGQSGRVRFAAGKGTVLAVPRRAVTRAGGTDGVFFVGDDNVAHLSPVTLGPEFGDRVEVLSGIPPGARVAVSPLEKLVDGAVVEPRR